MEKLVVIDGNSILNRAFYGIMGNKMLQTSDGTYTNAVYGFLSILFKTLEEVNPQFLAVAFDVKHPTKRHELYAEYKGTRKGMPDELAAQMPIIKNVLMAMNIKVIEMPGYEADDILGTLAVYAEKNNVEAVLLTGDRDSFQLASNKTTIRIPRTKQGKTETENFDRNKIIETYGVLPKQLIEVKGLMGDASDNIPGVPGIGEKTALSLIKEYESIDNLYKKIECGEAESVKGKTLEKLKENKDLAYLSRTLGTINTDSPIEKDLASLKIVDWNFEEVLKIFKDLRFNRFIERFDLENKKSGEAVLVDSKEDKELFENFILENENIYSLIQDIEKSKNMFYVFETENIDDENLIIRENIKYINIYSEEENKVYTAKFNNEDWKSIFENKDILKYGYKIKKDYILLKQNGITPQNIIFDASIAGYLINSTTNSYSLEELSKVYLSLDLDEFKSNETKEVQASLFDSEEVSPEEEKAKYICAVYAYVLGKLYNPLMEELKSINSLSLFNDIEMPTAEVLASMQYDGVYVDVNELVNFGNELKQRIEELRKEICELCGEEFNINSTKQLGEILFDKLKLTATKKTKSGYSTDVDALEKIKNEHPVINKILEYRQIMKLNSTYVEGLMPYIHKKTGRIHTYFHQTVTATGRLSSSDPNLQNIPTKTDLGKNLRRVFKAEEGKVFIDADYSQIELRVLAHMSNDEIMVNAFNQDVDIHTVCASQIFKLPIEEVTKELRSRAKAVNFGIVYGISDFGLAEQINMSRKEAKNYIENYLETYHGIRTFMENVVEQAKIDGYVTTTFGRRRYIPELKSNNFMVRKFGDRAAMNTPIQGTAADIMKIAMVNVYKKLKEHNLKSKIVLQIHDELLVETLEEEKEEVKKIVQYEMENVCKLNVPLKVEAKEGKDWLEAK